jgi:AcrR family transcriptional regulator
MANVPISERERADARRNRERILCAAARLVTERGIDEISMDDVAAAAGVGKGTLYRRFGDRSSLLRALIEDPEREFQDGFIRGEPPLGPGAPPAERLRAFGTALLHLLDSYAWFMREAETVKETRYGHPVYSAYRTHVALLLRELRGDDPTTEYLVDALLAPLRAESFLYQRDVLGLSLEDLVEGWCTLVDAVAATAVPAAPTSSNSQH